MNLRKIHRAERGAGFGEARRWLPRVPAACGATASVCAAALLSIASLSTFASESAATGAADEGSGLEEIVVTANRREQSEMSVGVSIDVLGGQDLSKLSLRDAAQITAYVPNMVESAIFGPGVSPNLAIRGVGMNDYNAASESPIAGYIDNVYVVYGGAYSFPLYDMDRIEVLRGPQGTLFGRNSTAGAIQFISEKPKQNFEASVGEEFGSYDTIKSDAMVNLPLIQDRLAARVAVHYQDNEGWLDNPSGLTGPGGQLITQDGRLQLLWTPVEGVSNLLRYSYDHASGDNYSMLHAAAENTEASNNSLVPAGVNFYHNCVQCDSFGNPTLGWVNNVSNSPKIVNANNNMVSNELNWSPSKGTTVTSITAYNRTYNEYEQDCDGTTMELCATHYINTETQFSQEIRAFIDGGDLRTTVGVYALSQHVSAYLPIAFDIPVTFVKGHEGLMVGSHDTQDAEGYAVFGNLEKDLAPEWTLTGGLRGAVDQKHIQESIGDYLDCPNDPGFAGFLNAGAIINGNIPTCGNIGFGSFTDTNAEGHNKFTSYTWSGKLELDFKPNAQTLEYVSLSHGSKAAAYSTGNVSLALFPQNGGPLTDLYVKPESVYSLETGVKLRALDDRLQLTGAIYYYDYLSFQELSFVGINDEVNTHKATNYGAELDLTYKPIRAITFNVNLGATKMRVQDVVNSYGVSATRDAPLSPHFTANAYARYDYRLPDGANLGAQMEMRHTASFYTEADNYNDEIVPASTRYNLRFDYTSASRKWDVGAYVDNLLNSRDLSEVYDLASDFGLQFSIPMPPRWFGVQFHYHFN
jgi:iron complex outermembrane recepter protein